MRETWKEIKDYKGLYEVSNFGRVRSLKRKTTKGKIVKQMFRSRYMFADLSKNGYRRAYSVGRLVALAFIPNPKKKPWVNHIDGNTKNNHIDNLEWCTPSENMQHAFDTGLKKPTRGEDNPKAKLTEKKVITIRTLFGQGDYKVGELAKMVGVSHQAISDIIKRKKWKHI